MVAFWLGATDSIPAAARDTAREEFRRSNAVVARYLEDTDISLVATVNDTVVIQLGTGFHRTVMLSGLDFPYGYLLIEPGFAEEFHTGIESADDLESAIDDYFGLGNDSPAPKHRIAQCTPCLTTLFPRRSLLLPHDADGPQSP